MNRMLIALFAVCVPMLSVASPPITEPVDVNVTNPTLTVQGSVQVSNDAAHLPYAQSQDDRIEPGQGPRSQILNFDIPTGKRLVIETITLQATSDGSRRVFLTPLVGDTRLFTFLAGQYQVPGYVVSTLPVKLRIDAVDGSTDEVRIVCGFAPEESTCGASVFGYLVDL